MKLFKNEGINKGNLPMFVYAEDLVLVPESESDLEMIEWFDLVCGSKHLKMNSEKSRMMMFGEA